MTRHIRTVVGLVVLLGSACCWNPVRAVETVPDAASAVAAGRVDEYLVSARAFLGAHATGPRAARVALDALMVASTHRKTAAVTEFKATLVMDHGQTLAGRFALSQFVDGKGCREFLDKLITQKIASLRPPTAQKYVSAVRRAAGFWGPEVLAGDGFLLKTALAADRAGDKAVRLQCLSRLKRDKPAVTRVAKLAFDPEIDEIKKIVGLQELSADVPVATDLVSHFLGRLSEAGRARPEILRVSGKNLLSDSHFAEARDVLRQLIKAVPDDGQAVVWSAWTEAVVGDGVEVGAAVSSLRSFARKHEKSEWAETATILAGAVAGHRRRLSTVVDEFGTVLADWRKAPPQLIKVKLVHALENGSKLDAFASFDATAKQFEATAVRNGGVVVAIRSAPMGSRLFFAEDPVIYRLNGKAIFPQPRFSITRDAEGTFQGLVQLTTSDKPTAMQDLTGMITSSPWLSSGKKLAEVVNHLVIKKGWYPAEAVHREGELRLRLLRPRVGRPGFHETTIQLDRRRQRMTVRLNRFDITIAYGDTKATEWLAGPDWPDVPSKTTADASMVFRLLGAVSNLLSDDVSRTATRPSPGVTR